MLGLFIDKQVFHSGKHGLPHKDLRTGNDLWGHTSFEKNNSIFAAWLYTDAGLALLMCLHNSKMKQNTGTTLSLFPASLSLVSVSPASLWVAEMGVSYCAA